MKKYQMSGGKELVFIDLLESGEKGDFK